LPQSAKTSNGPFPLAGKRIFVAGHRGMVGGALVRRLAAENCEILTIGRGELDLRDQAQTSRWMAEHRPQVVFMAAAKVGGILANNTLRADFIYDNLAIATSAIHASHEAGVEKLLFLGSTCIYPRLAAQPMREDALLTGPLEATNEPYAIAKIAGIKLAEAYRDQYGDDFVSVMPTNLYGPGDNYHPDQSHVVAALIRRFHEAKIAGAPEVVVWGTGTPRREFLFVDDLADACVFLTKTYSHRDIINVGCGYDVTIADLAQLIASVVGYAGGIVQDPSRPDGTPRKLVDVSKLQALGWQPRVSLDEGLELAYRDYLGRFGWINPERLSAPA
jgi:GDP-L-fucose synthase